MRFAPTLLAALIAAMAVPASFAQGADQAREGDTTYRPEVGQAGKDVIWVPTPPELASAMLKRAQVRPTDIVFDLGSGDGRIAIAAAKEFGARGYGIEFNGDMVSLARRNAQRAGVGNRVTFIQGDIFKTDFTKATVITMYLLPSLNLRLRDTVLGLRPGTRVVSHAFDMGEWQADEQFTASDRNGYLWIVPAKVGGRWAVTRSGRGAERLDLRQNFQMLSGTMAGRPLKSGRVRGGEVTLVMGDGQRLTGVMGPDGITGRGWSAKREGVNLAIEIAGWAGAALVLAAYAGASAGRLDARSALFQAMNLGGAAGMALNGWRHGALPSMALNLIWMAIGAAALARVMRSRAKRGRR